MYLDHDWKMPRGLMSAQARDPRNFSLAEWQQAKRTGQNARDLKTLIQECWAASDTRAAFAQALQERGLILAKGDRRGHVAVTHDGEVLSISRYTGKKTKEITARLGDPAALPSVVEAKAQHAKEMRRTFQRHVAEAQEQKRRALEPLEERRKAMAEAYRKDRAHLDQKQKDRWAEEARVRAARLHSGFKGLWQRLSGEFARIRDRNELEAYAALKRDQAQRDTVIFTQLQERRSLQAQIKAVRARYAALGREIKKDIGEQHQALAPAKLSAAFKQAEHPRPATHSERLTRLRSGRDSQQARLNKTPERDH